MKTNVHNLVLRWLVPALVALFATPCIACENGIAGLFSHHTHQTVQGISDTHLGTGCDTCENPHRESPLCRCLSGTATLQPFRYGNQQFTPDVAVSPMRIVLPEPTVLRVAGASPSSNPPPLLVHPAVSGRAPPAV